MNLDRVVFSWQVSPYFGWGVVGINMMLHWPGTALSSMPEPQAALASDDPRFPLLAERCRQSRRWQDEALRPPARFQVEPAPVFVALGNDLDQPRVANNYMLRGIPTVAFPVFEDVESVRGNIDRLREYPIVITASRWNHDVLAELGVASRMVHQGYDPVLFNPGIRKKRAAGRFRVFSGGKAEYRKGQDLVLEGFKIFAEKHDDAVLVAAWDSPWPKLAASFAQTCLGMPPGTEIGRPNFAAWAQHAGIPHRQFIAVQATPNYLMPHVLSEIDCALFASRFEGGTNIAAMECLGCGIPTILTASTGHRALQPCRWVGEDPEEIAAALDVVYTAGQGCHTTAPTHFESPRCIAELLAALRHVD